MTTLGYPVSTGQVRELLRNTEIGSRLSGLTDDALLADAGMDSLDIFEVVGELERVSGLAILDDDLENVSTIAAIAKYLNERIK